MRQTQVGPLRAIKLRLKHNRKGIGVGTSLELIQNCALLGTARILRKILEVKGGERGENRQWRTSLNILVE